MILIPETAVVPLKFFVFFLVPECPSRSSPLGTDARMARMCLMDVFQQANRKLSDRSDTERCFLLVVDILLSNTGNFIWQEV